MYRGRVYIHTGASGGRRRLIYFISGVGYPPYTGIEADVPCCVAAAADAETVTGGAAPIIGVQDFDWGLSNDSWRARVQSLPPSLFSTAASDFHRLRRRRREGAGAGSGAAVGVGGKAVTIHAHVCMEPDLLLT